MHETRKKMKRGWRRRRGKDGKIINKLITLQPYFALLDFFSQSLSCRLLLQTLSCRLLSLLLINEDTFIERTWTECVSLFDASDATSKTESKGVEKKDEKDDRDSDKEKKSMMKFSSSLMQFSLFVVSCYHSLQEAVFRPRSNTEGRLT